MHKLKLLQQMDLFIRVFAYQVLKKYSQMVLFLLKCLREKREYFMEVTIFNIVFYIA